MAAEDKRWRVETGGMVVGGVRIATDDRSKSLIFGTFAYLTENPTETTEWKTEGRQWVPITLEGITPIFNAMGAHVKSCFAAEKAICALIAAGTITTTEQIDAWEDWPGSTS